MMTKVERFFLYLFVAMIGIVAFQAFLVNPLLGFLLTIVFCIIAVNVIE